jgi:hypothetical protein
MGYLSLYKTIYKVTSGGTNYELITPQGISATTYNQTGLNVIENLSPELYSTGIYFVNIDSSKYNDSTVYQIHWNIVYNQLSGNKKIKGALLKKSSFFYIFILKNELFKFI